MAIIIYRAAVNADHVGNTNVRIKHRQQRESEVRRGKEGAKMAVARAGGREIARSGKRRLLCLRERDQDGLGQCSAVSACDGKTRLRTAIG